MGDVFAWDNEPQRAKVTQGAMTYIVQAGQANAKIDGKDKPVLAQDSPFLNLEYPSEPASLYAKPFVYNKTLYVPAEFLQKELGYAVETRKIGTKLYAFVGTLPNPMPVAQEPTPTPQPQPKPEPAPSGKLDLKWKVPEGWVPPEIKSVATEDPLKNEEILAKELPLYQGVFYSPYVDDPSKLTKPLISGIAFSIGYDENWLAQIYFEGWHGYKDKVDIYNKVPYVGREVFQFYLPKSYMTLFNIMEDWSNGKDVSKYLNKPFTLDGRKIEILYDKKFTGFDIYIGYKK
ncbi:conserved hypothetical protein [[Clostridium] ultunense Esp]|nr:conserved hypothetical protein [[Clostridium] ultunense Esp]